MKLSPNQFVLLLKIRRLYMLDSYLQNGFRSANALAENVVNSYSPSRTARDFIRDLMFEDVLFIQGSLKINLEKCDKLIKSDDNYRLCKEFIAENFNLIGKGFFIDE